MLIRKLKRHDCIVVGDVVILVRKSTEGNLTLAIQAPGEVEVCQAREGEVLQAKNDEAPR